MMKFLGFQSIVVYTVITLVQQITGNYTTGLISEVFRARSAEEHDCDKCVGKHNNKSKRDHSNEQVKKREPHKTTTVEEEKAKKISHDKDKNKTLNATTSEEYSYVVLLAISVFPKSEGISVCTGSLLTPRWTITSARCFSVKKFSEVLVYVGGKSLNEVKEKSLKEVENTSTEEVGDKSYEQGSQVQIAKFIYQHPRFDPESENQLQYDVALVKVRDEFTLTKSVNTVALPGKPWCYRGTAKCMVTGFGEVKNQTGQDYFWKSHFLDVDTNDGCSCIGRTIQVRQVLLCSKPEEGNGICAGDRGAGLICDGQLVAVVVGFKSYKDLGNCTEDRNITEQCTNKNTLNMFQQIHPYISWVRSYIPANDDGYYNLDIEKGSTFADESFTTTIQTTDILILACYLVISFSQVI